MDQRIREQIEYATRIVSEWPAWKQNILWHSGQATNATPRQPVASKKD